VFNLLSNAFKHTGNGEKIVLQLATEEASGQLRMVVANSGVHLTQPELDRLFEQFFIGHATQTTKMGTGIGLAFTKELAGLLHGSISVACQEGWISFTLLLPLHFVPDAADMVTGSTAKQEQPSALIQDIAEQAYVGKPAEESNKQSLIAALQPSERKSILVVDDEPAIRFLLKDVLSEHYLVYEAENGQQAMELVRHTLPSLIISDIMMPDMDGLELCARIKNIPETCHIPVVLLTAKGTLEQQTEGYDAGADAYIPKPFQLDHLLVRVRKLLEYRQQLHNLFAQDNNIPGHLPDEGMKEADRDFLGRIYQLVEEQLDNTELDAAYLEKALSLSRMQLYRKLKSLTDMPPNEFIRHIRLQKAAQLLKTTKLTVSEIFYQTGFNNQSYFFREFKKLFDCSPNEYRQQYQVRVE
jgi:DNA-binding response OmpR family regulator